MGGGKHVEDWAADWDFYSRQYHEDAPAVWSELRERCPTPRTPRYGGAWALIRHDDVCAAAHDVDTFSSRHPSLLEDYEAPSTDIAPIDLDPPLHSTFRRVMLPQFGPSATAALRPLTEQICEDLLDDLAGRTTVDASADYAKHIPVAVTAAMLGVPAGDAEMFRGWVHDIVERPDEPANLTQADGTWLRRARNEDEMLVAEAELYLLINFGGVAQTDDDAARARRVAGIGGHPDR